MWALYKQEAHGAAGAYYNQNSTSLKACEFTGLFFFMFVDQFLNAKLFYR